MAAGQAAKAQPWAILNLTARLQSAYFRKEIQAKWFAWYLKGKGDGKFAEAIIFPNRIQPMEKLYYLAAEGSDDKKYLFSCEWQTFVQPAISNGKQTV